MKNAIISLLGVAVIGVSCLAGCDASHTGKNNVDKENTPPALQENEDKNNDNGLIRPRYNGDGSPEQNHKKFWDGKPYDMRRKPRNKLPLPKPDLGNGELPILPDDGQPENEDDGNDETLPFFPDDDGDAEDN